MFDRRSATALACRSGKHPWAWARRFTNRALCPLQSPLWLCNRRVHITNNYHNTAVQQSDYSLTVVNQVFGLSITSDEQSRLHTELFSDSLTVFQEFLGLLIFRWEILTETQMVDE